MQGKSFHIVALLVLMLGLSSCTNVRQTTDEPSKRTALAATAFPEQRRYQYIDIPAADNGLSNLMVRAVIGEAAWMEQLTTAMARGANAPTYLVVGSHDNGVAYSAVKKALDTFKGKQLPQLHLALIGDTDQAERLRIAAEALGCDYRVLPLMPR